MKDFLIGILPFRVFLVKVKTASGYSSSVKTGYFNLARNVAASAAP